MANTKPRRYGLTNELIPYIQQNAGRVLTIDELMSNHPLGTTLERGQISGAMNNLVKGGHIRGLTRGKLRGTWIYQPNAAAKQEPPKDDNLGAAIVDIVAVDGEGKYIGVDKDNGRVFKMERIA